MDKLVQAKLHLPPSGSSWKLTGVTYDAFIFSRLSNVHAKVVHAPNVAGILGKESSVAA